VKFRVTCRKSRLYHSDAVAERLGEAAAGRVAGVVASRSRDSSDDSEASEGDAQLFIVRITHDDCVVSVDSSGELLHRRGYRLASGKAPVRETLAAAMLIASDWDKASPLIDPMCGSGTIPIEAAMMARGIPPGAGRDFAFERWPSYVPAVWNHLRESIHQNYGQTGVILASDRDDGVVKFARDNAARAGVENAIEFTTQAISHLNPPPGPGWIATNPPYGVRVGESAPLRNLYSQFGKILRQKAPGYLVCLLSADRRLERLTGIPFVTRLSTKNGGIPVRLVTGKVP
jgi:putative N6-adenine-specific DNA methylase